jgi:hypothetical protein
VNDLKNLLESDDVFASTLLLMAAQTFGPEAVGLPEASQAWVPETFRYEFSEEWGAILSDENLGKLTAAIAVVTTNHLYRGVPSFLMTIHGLIGDGTDWSYGEPLDAEDLAWGITEAMLLWPPGRDTDDEDSDTVFDPSIVAYCQNILRSEGVKSPPSVLSFAREQDIYEDLGQEDFDVLSEQATQTQELNEYLEQRQEQLLMQLESVKIFGIKTDTLLNAMQAELMQLAELNRFS